MRTTIQAVLLLLMVPLIANPQWFAFVGTQPSTYYLAVTVALLALTLGQVITTHKLPTAPVFHLRHRVHSLVPLFGVVLVLLGAALTARFVAEFQGVPLDPMSADMLPLLNAASARFISGHNPYVIYRDAAPWPLPLVYGPVLWMPYALTSALRLDPRYMTTFCMALTVAFLLSRAYVAVKGDDCIAALVLTALPLAVLGGKPVLRFIRIGHTQVYWPLLVLLYLAIEREHFSTASIVLGLLVVARSTMLSIIPVYLLFLFTQHRPRFARSALLLAFAIVLPLLPFALLDHHMLYESMVMNYLTVIKPMIWSKPEWLDKTFGITSYLVNHNLGRLLTCVQIAATTAVYAAAFIFLKKRENLLVWMALALIVFSMTLFWPVQYVYFDVLVLLALACAASVATPTLTPNRPIITL